MEKLTDAIGIVLFESEKFGGEKVLRGGICPTLRANKTSSGVIEVMADVNVIGSLESKFESTNRIYDVGGVQSNIEYNASTVTSRYYKGIGSHKDNMCIVAMRGRNPNNPSDRTVGNQTEQRLEVNMQGTSNCLTSVQKDNLVIESQVLTPKRTEYGKQIRKAYESGQIQESRHNMTELEPRKDDISNTLTTVQKDNLLLENNIQKVGQISSNGSQCGTVISDNGISANLVAGTHGYANSHIATQCRIRKLTPRECGRLMGVSDEDIDKMAAVNSNTQLYKQFGNSIVVDVMCAMFKNLNINQGDSNEALQTD